MSAKGTNLKEDVSVLPLAVLLLYSHHNLIGLLEGIRFAFYFYYLTKLSNNAAVLSLSPLLLRTEHVDKRILNIATELYGRNIDF